MAYIDAADAGSWSKNTEEWWSVNGVSLHEYGWSVTTVGGSRYDLPPKRGSNLSIAYRPGQVHRTKIPDARTITLVMWMVGWVPDQGPVSGPLTDVQRLQWNDNWDFLRRLVFKDYLTGARNVLTRRWRLTTPPFPLDRGGTDTVIAGDPGTNPPGLSRIVTASAAAEMTGSMAPTMTGRTRSDFTMDFLLADPYFYGPLVTATLAMGGTPVYVWNDGHDVAGHTGLTVDLVGPLTNPVLTNLTTNPDCWVKYTGTIAAGQTLTLNVGRYSAYQHPSNAATPQVNKIAGLSNGGARLWTNLMPGANKLLLTGSGTGTAVLKFQPPYV